MESLFAFLGTLIELGTRTLAKRWGNARDELYANFDGGSTLLYFLVTITNLIPGPRRDVIGFCFSLFCIIHRHIMSVKAFYPLVCRYRWNWSIYLFVVESVVIYTLADRIVTAQLWFFFFTALLPCRLPSYGCRCIRIVFLSLTWVLILRLSWRNAWIELFMFLMAPFVPVVYGKFLWLMLFSG